MYGCATVKSMPASFTCKSALTGCGVTLPPMCTVPVSLMVVSSITFTGLDKSRLASSTVMDNGASTTLAAGLTLRSSADSLASGNSNLCRFTVHGGFGVAGWVTAVVGKGALGAGACAVGVADTAAAGESWRGPASDRRLKLPL